MPDEISLEVLDFLASNTSFPKWLRQIQRVILDLLTHKFTGFSNFTILYKI